MAEFSLENHKNGVLRLYACLENIAETKDGKIVKTDEDIESEFELFFKKYREELKTVKIGLLQDKKFLTEGKFGAVHRMKGGDQNKEESTLNGDSLLLRAVSINVSKDRNKKKKLDAVIKLIVDNCPELISFTKISKHCDGVTPVHLAIVQEDDKRLMDMANGLEKEKDGKKKMFSCAEGPIFQETVMMAGTLLGVASLKFNEEIFCIVLQNFAYDVDVTNGKGDNIIHSLIKYAQVQPEKIDSVLKMLSFILDCKFIQKGEELRKKKEKNLKKQNMSKEIIERELEKHTFSKDEFEYRKQVRKLLMMKNKEKLTALQLAARRQQFRIFETIIHHEVYLTREVNDGLFNEDTYDVTEIETIGMEKEVIASDTEDIKTEHHESVLEYLLYHQTTCAFQFANVTPVKQVIEEKWKHYKPWFYVGFSIYLIFLITLSYAAILRSKVTESLSKNNPVRYVHVVGEDVFVTSVSVIGTLAAIFLILMELMRQCCPRFQSKMSSKWTKLFILYFGTPYSNVMFRVYFVLFSILLIADCIAAASRGSVNNWYGNFFLIFAIIIGWYLVLFFLQVFKLFSFYTVLIQRVINDMFRFAFPMGIFLLSFSIAMFMIMQDSNTENEDFDNLGRTMVKMLTIMLGIGELEVLFQAQHPALAVTVFILFVLLTTILLLNALIAMMSNTCTDLMSNNAGVVATKMHYRLQKLSVILFLEGCLPRRFCKVVGKSKQMLRYDSENNKEQKRLRLQWTRNTVHALVETESDETTEPVQLFNKTLDVSGLLETIIPKQIMKPKRSKKHKIYPVSLQRRLDITDTERRTCDHCQNNSAVLLQTQEIAEVTEYI